MKKTHAKLFQNEGSQTVRIEPADEWPESFRACLGAWPEGIPRPEPR